MAVSGEDGSVVNLAGAEQATREKSGIRWEAGRGGEYTWCQRMLIEPSASIFKIVWCPHLAKTSWVG